MKETLLTADAQSQKEEKQGKSLRNMKKKNLVTLAMGRTT